MKKNYIFTFKGYKVTRDTGENQFVTPYMDIKDEEINNGNDLYRLVRDCRAKLPNINDLELTNVYEVPA